MSFEFEFSINKSEWDEINKWALTYFKERQPNNKQQQLVNKIQIIRDECEKLEEFEKEHE